jgi:hypothetical protein
MKEIKKRTINELRQVKGFGYVAPHSHRKRHDEVKVIMFTKSTLADFTHEIITKLVFASHLGKLPRLKEDIELYIKENLND